MLIYIYICVMFITKVQNRTVLCVINFSILINITNFPPIMRSRGSGQLTAVELSTVIVKGQYGANSHLLRFATVSSFTF